MTRETRILVFSGILIPLVASLAIFQQFLSSILLLSFVAFVFVIWLVLLNDVYKDSKSKGLNENYWVLPFFLQGIGGLIYYYISRQKTAPIKG